METLLEMKNIVKAFSENIVLAGVGFTLNKGEVHSLVGVNGAGKSTLIKILNGIYHADEGEIYIDGNRVDIKSPHDAEVLGIRFVHQELNICPDLNVAENIFVGNLKSSKFGFFDKQKTIKKAQELIDKVKIDIKATEMVRNLRAAEKQIIEILKALTMDSRVLVLDEPTSSLSEQEKIIFFDLLNNLKHEGVSFIFISHFLEDVLQFSDRVTVIKDGLNNGIFDANQISKNELIYAMMGKNIEKNTSSTRTVFDKSTPVLELKDFCSFGKFDNINLTLYPGKVMGVCGLLGAGKSEIARAIFGLDEFDSGEVFINGNKQTGITPIKMMKNKIAIVTEDRKVEGFAPLLSIKENISVSIINNLCNRFGFINSKKQNQFAEKLSQRMTVKKSSIEQNVGELSGGNQQKVIIGRCVATNPKVFLLDEPTRGVDVYAKEEIYKTLISMANEGVGIIIFSSELEELLAVCDEIAVLKSGNLISIVEARELSKSKLLEMIT